jgi:hypothetical protein
MVVVPGPVGAAHGSWRLSFQNDVVNGGFSPWSQTVAQEMGDARHNFRECGRYVIVNRASAVPCTRKDPGERQVIGAAAWIR